MRDVLQRLRRALESAESGQGMVEYTMILGSIAIVLVAAFVTSGIESAMGALANDIATSIQP